jgi:hypothetical protein
MTSRRHAYKHCTPVRFVVFDDVRAAEYAQEPSKTHKNRSVKALSAVLTPGDRVWLGREVKKHAVARIQGKWRHLLTHNFSSALERQF